MLFIPITSEQIDQFTKEIAKRWKFQNFGSYYNIIDTQTGQQSNDGGDSNFASYYFSNAVRLLYLKTIGQDSLYLNWQKSGVKESNDRNTYLLYIANEIVCRSCDFVFKNNENELMLKRLMD